MIPASTKCVVPRDCHASNPISCGRIRVEVDAEGTRHVRCDAPRFVLRQDFGLQRLGWVRPAVDVGKRLVVGIAHDVATRHLFGALWCGKAALAGHHADPWDHMRSVIASRYAVAASPIINHSATALMRRSSSMRTRAFDEKVESMMGDSHDGANRIQDPHCEANGSLIKCHTATGKQRLSYAGCAMMASPVRLCWMARWMDPTSWRMSNRSLLQL